MKPHSGQTDLLPLARFARREARPRSPAEEGRRGPARGPARPGHDRADPRGPAPVASAVPRRGGLPSVVSDLSAYAPGIDALIAAKRLPEIEAVRVRHLNGQIASDEGERFRS